jgi:hypothetical protein
MHACADTHVTATTPTRQGLSASRTLRRSKEGKGKGGQQRRRPVRKKRGAPAAAAAAHSPQRRPRAMASPAPGAVDAALELMRRLPPEAVVDNLTALLSAAPELTEELLSRVDQPLQVAVDGVSGREFLLCDYNRDADAYRRVRAATSCVARGVALCVCCGTRKACSVPERVRAFCMCVCGVQVAVEQRVLSGAGGRRQAAGGAAGACTRAEACACVRNNDERSRFAPGRRCVCSAARGPVPPTAARLLSTHAAAPGTRSLCYLARNTHAQQP